MSSGAIMMEIQRALGRIEGEVHSLRRDTNQNFRDLREDFGVHKQDDQRNFSALRIAMKEQSTAFDGHLDSQDTKLNDLAVVNTRLEEQDKNTKAIGAYILGVIGSFTLLIGGAVVAAVAGHIKFSP